MATTEKYTTVIELNSEQAKRNLDELRRKVESWKSDLAEAREKKMGRSFIAAIRKELSEAEKELKKYDTEVARTIDTMNDLQSASVDRIEEAQKSLKRLASEVPHDSPFFEQLNNQLDMVTQELENIKATKAFEKLQMEAEGVTKSAEQLKAELTFIKETAANAETASVRQLELAEKTAQNIKETSQRGSDEWNEASASLEKIQGRLSAIEEEEKKVVTVIDRYNKELEQAGKKAEQVKNETELVDRTLGKLNSASVRDIEYSIKVLNEELRNTERTGDDVEKLTEKLKQLNAELKKVQDMQKPEGKKDNIFARGMTFLNKNWGAITQTLAAYSGLRDVVHGSVEAFAEMDQEMNNVRKYTGQTIEEVQALNDKFKEMDTRTPREQLNQLAGSAGRLGITGEQAIMDFVYAADQINIALGDDLGKGAVDKIGKLTMAFGEDDRMGLRDAMLSTGSAVNELAQNSAAQAGYLVDFAARLSGVGVQAGLTQAQILGLGAAMDENMQRDEMAATALSQIITKMTTDSETFARIAGKNVEEFSNLVRTDMNSALMQFFESMNKKGGFAELAPLFEQMGLDGTRAIGVLSTLASKIDDVRKHQELATKAYQEHTSVEAEAAIQNDTYQAKLEKARKAFSDLRIELGEKLLPVASVAISTTSMLVRALSAIIDFIIKYKGVIVTLTASILAYVAAVKLQWLWSQRYVVQAKIKTVWMAIEDKWLAASILKHRVLKGEITAAAAAQQFFNNVLKMNPYGLAIAGLTALIGMYIRYATSTDSAEKAQRRLKEIEEEANRNRPKEIDEIARLKKTIEDANVSIDNRREAIRELQKIVPEYHASLTNEGKLIGHNTELLNVYTQQLKNSARIQAAASKLPQAEEDRDKWFNEAPENFQAAYFNEKVNGMDEESAAVAAGAVPRLYKAFKKHLAELESAVDQYNGIIDRLTEENQKLADAIGGIDKTTSEGNTQEYDTRQFWEKEVELRKAKLDALRNDANATRAEIEKAKEAYDDAKKAVEAFTGQKEYTRQERAEDKARRERERKANDAAKAETEQQLAELTHRYAMGKVLYCDYIDEQERIQLEGIERRMLIYRTESLEYQKLNRQREELLLNGSEESRKLSLAQMKQGHEQRLAAIEEQAWRENMTEQQKNEMVFREDMRFLDEQRILYRKGTLERINLEREIDETEQQHKLQRAQYYQQQLQQVREQYLGLANERVKELALKNLDELHAQGLLKEREYQEAKLAIEAQYANYETNTEHDQRVGANALKVAQDRAKQKLDGATVPEGSSSGTANLPIVGDIMLYQSTMEQLKQMYQNDEMTHAQYLAAKQQATAQFCASLASQMQAAYNSVNQVLSAASNYFSAQQEYETAQVQKKYEKQIEAAGNNQKKVKKLQEKQAKEEAAIKTKYAKRAAAIQMAQAVAQTAISAINAYSSAAAIPVVGHVLAPIAAAMAIAAGMLQIATIKKQQQAQAAGYYEGGFTGGHRYRKEAGVVHEGEFVANHQAVQNPNILPFLNFLDQAQRNNTVGSLSMQDVSRSMGAGGAAQIVTPIVNVQTDNEQLNGTLQLVNESIGALNQQLLDGIHADVVIDGPQGLHKQYGRFLKLNDRV